MSELLLVRTNGAALNRRNKRVQQEVIKAAGLRSVHQCSGKVFSDVEAFLKRELTVFKHWRYYQEPINDGSAGWIWSTDPDNHNNVYFRIGFMYNS
jgi:hypothetical protein